MISASRSCAGVEQRSLEGGVDLGRHVQRGDEGGEFEVDLVDLGVLGGEPGIDPVLEADEARVDRGEAVVYGGEAVVGGSGCRRAGR